MTWLWTNSQVEDYLKEITWTFELRHRKKKLMLRHWLLVLFMQEGFQDRNASFNIFPSERSEWNLLFCSLLATMALTNSSNVMPPDSSEYFSPNMSCKIQLQLKSPLQTHQTTVSVTPSRSRDCSSYSVWKEIRDSEHLHVTRGWLDTGWL